MLDTNMKTQLKAYLEKLTKPVELIATLDDSAKSAEIKELLAEIAELSDKVTFKEDNSLPVRKPSFLITNPGSNQGPRFAGSPSRTSCPRRRGCPDCARRCSRRSTAPPAAEGPPAARSAGA